MHGNKCCDYTDNTAIGWTLFLAVQYVGSSSGSNSQRRSHIGTSASARWTIVIYCRLKRVFTKLISVQPSHCTDVN